MRHESNDRPWAIVMGDHRLAVIDSSVVDSLVVDSSVVDSSAHRHDGSVFTDQ
jgi:hypothetical protein